MATGWTKNDKKRVQRILAAIAAKNDGWQGIADLLKIKAEGRRGTVHAWHTRGRVPLKHIKAVQQLAVAAGEKCSLTDLNPEAYFLEVTA